MAGLAPAINVFNGNFRASAGLLCQAGPLQTREARNEDLEMQCRPTWGRLRTLALSLILLLGPAISAAQTPRLKNIGMCNGEERPDFDSRIKACTALIEVGDESQATVAIAYNNRGNAYLEKGELDLAIRDLDQAAKLSPESG